MQSNPLHHLHHLHHHYQPVACTLVLLFAGKMQVIIFNELPDLVGS